MRIFVVFLACLAGAFIIERTPVPYTHMLANLHSETGTQGDIVAIAERDTLSGNYLASQFAQRHHDWRRAGDYMEKILAYNPDDPQAINKRMVLAMGSGQTDEAMVMARKIVDTEQDNSLPLMFLAAGSFRQHKYEEATGFIKRMPEGSLSGFILPLLESWARAGEGVFSIEGLGNNTIHLYHAILIADFLNRKEEIQGLLQKALSIEVSLQDLERLADVYAYIGKNDIAVQLYEKISGSWPENRPLAQKIDRLKAGSPVKAFHSIRSPEGGVAAAMYEMARLLYQEYSDDSARVFAHMALYLDPTLSDADLLLGYITTRNARYGDAIVYYRNIAPGQEKYAEARRMAADMLEDANRTDEAIAELKNLVSTQNDLEALIQIGDIYRRREDFGQAVATYNHAAELLGKTIPKEYWQLYYVRGMSYERLGEWDRAESDLKTALTYQPNHPMILNYLGYAWADQGRNLDQSLELIRKAASLDPSDGYITDSLGWVLYRMGRYGESVPHLEKAVELLPYDPVINDHLGDAYWRVGRKLEARFQWERAKNHSRDQKLITDISKKLDRGLQNAAVITEAKPPGEAEIMKP